jgi:hypothetical protein
MANPQIKFYKGASAPATLTAGMIWFNTKNRTIQVYTGTAWEIYTGLVDATYANNQLTITKAVGDPLVLDFNSMLGSISGLGERLDDYDTWKAETVTPVITAFNENFDIVKAASEANTAKLAGLTKATVKAEITAEVAAEAGRVDGLLATVNKSIEDMGVDVAANKASAADYATFKANHEATVNGYIDAKVNALGGDKTGSDDYVSVQVTTAKGEVSGVVVNTDALTTKIGNIDLVAGENKTAIEALGKKVGAPVAVEGQSAYSESYTVAQDIKAAKDAAAAAQADIDAFLAGVEIGTDKVVDTLKEIQHFLEGEDGTVAALLEDVANNRADIDVAKAQLAGVGEGETVKNLIAAAKSEVVDGATEGYATLGDLEVKVKALEGAVGTEGSVAEAIEAAVKPERERIDAYDTWKAGLEVADAAVEGQYVSQVKQVAGKIEVTRVALPDWTNTINGAVTAGIEALDAEVKDETGYITGSVKQVDGKLTEISIDAAVGAVADGEDKLATAASVKTFVENTFSWSSFN